MMAKKVTIENKVDNLTGVVKDLAGKVDDLTKIVTTIGERMATKEDVENLAVMTQAEFKEVRKEMNTGFAEVSGKVDALDNKIDSLDIRLSVVEEKA